MLSAFDFLDFRTYLKSVEAEAAEYGAESVAEHERSANTSASSGEDGTTGGEHSGREGEAGSSSSNNNDSATTKMPKKMLMDLPAELLVEVLAQVSVEEDGTIDIMANAFANCNIVLKTNKEMLHKAGDNAKTHLQKAFKAKCRSVDDITTAWARWSALLAVLPLPQTPRTLVLIISFLNEDIYDRLRPFMVEKYLQRTGQSARNVRYKFASTEGPDHQWGIYLREPYATLLRRSLGRQLIKNAAEDIKSLKHIDDMIEDARRRFLHMSWNDYERLDGMIPNDVWTDSEESEESEDGEDGEDYEEE